MLIQRNKQVSCSQIHSKWNKPFSEVTHDVMQTQIQLQFISSNTFGSNESMYKATKVLYSNPVTEWFNTTSGVKQGDSLSPTLFGIYLNGIVAELTSYDLWVILGDITNSILLFADDIVLINDSDVNLQRMLIIVSNW